MPAEIKKSIAAILHDVLVLVDYFERYLIFSRGACFMLQNFFAVYGSEMFS